MLINRKRKRRNPCLPCNPSPRIKRKNPSVTDRESAAFQDLYWHLSRSANLDEGSFSEYSQLESLREALAIMTGQDKWLDLKRFERYFITPQIKKLMEKFASELLKSVDSTAKAFYLDAKLDKISNKRPITIFSEKSRWPKR